LAASSEVLDALFSLLVDAADVADHVAAGLAQRVVAKQPRLDLHAGKAVALRGEARHLLVGQAGADRQRLEALARSSCSA
jgi:ABC-type taurine transport system ATPase subunit